MDFLKNLLGVRPKADTREALEAALSEAERASAAAQDRVANLQRDRGARLLDAQPDAVAATEAQLAEARAEVERFSAVIPVLRERVEAAKTTEIRLAAARAVQEAEDKGEAFVRFWRERYPGLAKELSAGLLLELEARAARERAAKAITAAERHGPTGLALPQSPAETLWPKEPQSVYGLSAWVSLPPTDGPAGHNRPSFWPPERSILEGASFSPKALREVREARPTRMPVSDARDSAAA